jgi:hypothetical protein
MDRDLLPKDSVKKLGLLKIYLLPKKTTLLTKLTSISLQFQE